VKSPERIVNSRGYNAVITLATHNQCCSILHLGLKSTKQIVISLSNYNTWCLFDKWRFLCRRTGN